jgi:hypothetical protein
MDFDIFGEAVLQYLEGSSTKKLKLLKKGIENNPAAYCCNGNELH